MSPTCSCLLLESVQNGSNSVDAAEPLLANSYQETPHTVRPPAHPPVAYAIGASAGTAPPTPHPMQAHSPPLFPSPSALAYSQVALLSAPPVVGVESLWR